jgi:hypothetical protein
MSKITYEDIKQRFNESDLKAYNLLCREFLRLTANKNNAELWNMVQSQSALRIVLDTIHKLRGKYDFLGDDIFFKVWRFNPSNKQHEEMHW